MSVVALIEFYFKLIICITIPEEPEKGTCKLGGIPIADQPFGGIWWCTCKGLNTDPIIQAQFMTTEPIIPDFSSVVTRTFVPTGTWTVIGLSPDPINFEPIGSMTVNFTSDSRFPSGVSATISNLQLSTIGLPDGDILATLFPPIPIAITNTRNNTFNLFTTSSALDISLETGETRGYFGATTSIPSPDNHGNIAFKGGVNGSLDFRNGTWTWTAQGDLTVCCKVPEPSTVISLLTLGTLGAASTLKRKLKPSQSTEKETTKVG
ncbi:MULTISPECIES: PEP-CTERM sorting domain-containing protein [unclassified Microcystis]|uniref:PEP-CTERM sorting domain-containing protein n=1 Tax=unclassified Microcystis TaxID=2643300 RepID=UPI0025794927|nr:MULTISPECIES: PEP-CTERM sorting domain-containing protein [unclassified Microcystis]